MCKKFQFAYQGISYLDQADEAILQKLVQENMLFHNVEQSISYTEEEDFKNIVVKIFQWLNTASDDTDSFKIESPTPTLQYFMHKELRKRFPNIWTLSGNNMVTFQKIKAQMFLSMFLDFFSFLDNCD